MSPSDGRHIITTRTEHAKLNIKNYEIFWFTFPVSTSGVFIHNFVTLAVERFCAEKEVYISNRNWPVAKKCLICYISNEIDSTTLSVLINCSRDHGIAGLDDDHGMVGMLVTQSHFSYPMGLYVALLFMSAFAARVPFIPTSGFQSFLITRK
jgi:hypothetical protein